jgi:hypothetical protein
MRLQSFFTIVSGVAVTGLLATAPVFAQSSDQPVVATITVPVTIDFLDTEQMSPPPAVSCILYSTIVSSNGILAQGSAPVPMVSTQATTTARSTSSFSGNVVVTLHSKAAMMGPGGAGSLEAAAQAGAKAALSQARNYECNLSGVSSATAGAGAGPKWTGFIMQGTKEIRPLKSTLMVKGTTAGKP